MLSLPATSLAPCQVPHHPLASLPQCLPSAFRQHLAARQRASASSASASDSAEPSTTTLATLPTAPAVSTGQETPAQLHSEECEAWPGVYEGYWRWRGHRIRYLRSGDSGPPVLCVHGFGGNADHWRNNLPTLGTSCRAFAIDLLGYGKSDKPDPREQPVNSIYNFENWSQQLRDFIAQRIGGPTLLTCNSVGGLAGLQAAFDDSTLVPAVQVMNISLRMLHVSKQAPWQRPLVKALQSALRTTALGPAFFAQIATKDGVRSVLKQCYGNPTLVTDELVDVILTPGLSPAAVHVFLDFISYSGGPLPEELMLKCPVPVSVVWGAKDPW
jgi:pimeloyl-ACP methyl ester carboxylesterase